MKMDLLPANNENLLADFPPILRRNFKELFCHGRIGLSPITLNDVSPTKHYTEDNCSYSYYYTLRISYAGRRLVWELIFDPEDMKFAPDFNFNDDHFELSTEIEAVIANVPTLANWNVNNPKSLTLVLREFLNLYKIQQLEKLQKENIYSQLLSEYQILTEEVHERDIELYLDDSATFLINIKVDTSTLPEYLQPMRNGQVDEYVNPCEDTCILKVSYSKLDGSRAHVTLTLSPRLEQVLNTAHDLQIPAYPRTVSLADYVSLVRSMLQEHVKKIEQHHKLKKEYIMCMCAMYPEHIVEFDAEIFSRAELLCEVDGYFCIVRIELGELFPEEQPTVNLFSIYCCVSPKKMCSEKITNCLYSPRWSPENMLRKLMTSLKETIPKFKNHKH